MVRIKKVLIAILTVCIFAFLFCACDNSKVDYAYYISVNVQDTKTEIGVSSSGEYVLEEPILEGYEFIHFVDKDGNDFALSGVIASSVSVYAEFNVLETSDFVTLKGRIEKGVKDILVASDISINETLYVYDNLNLYTEGEYTLKRDDDFLGDLFVVGENANGDNPILQDRTVTLRLSAKEGGKLIFDGNKEQVMGDVNGSAFYITNSATLETYDGVTIKNFKKTANDRLTADFGDIWDNSEDAGGSAIMIAYGAFDMYGGTICDNECSIDTSLSQSGYGGAIYNRSTLNMYGGEIKNNKGNRAGAIYNYRTSNIYNGDIVGNEATTYGGAIYMPNSQYTTLIIGDDAETTKVNISDNNALKSGGAIFGQTLTNFVIYEGTVFARNHAGGSGNGGAINTSGPILANGVTFTENIAGSKGGAIYITYKHPENTVRISEFNNCTFIGNEAKMGGALLLYSEETDYNQGAEAYVSECEFKQNVASENGGSIYVGRSSLLNVSKSIIKESEAGKNGGGIYVTDSVLKMNDENDVLNNKAVLGGGVYATSGATVWAEKVKTEGNVASKGGFLYITSDETEFTLFSGNITGNTATDAGGGNAIWSNKATAVIRFDGGLDTSKIVFNISDIAGKSSVIDIERGE